MFYVNIVVLHSSTNPTFIVITSVLKWFDDMVRNLKESLLFYSSPINPKTRKGGGMTRSQAIAKVRKESFAGTRVWEQALDELGWK